MAALVALVVVVAVVVKITLAPHIADVAVMAQYLFGLGKI
jgi:hypothetical protein